MGRKRTLTDEVLSVYYGMIVTAINNNDSRFVYQDKLSQLTGLKPSQISKAIQWGRREFKKGSIPIRSYVLASPHGYFLAQTGQEIVAYVAQYQQRIKSEIRTQNPIYDYAFKHWPEQLLNALEGDHDENDSIDDETRPWDVFNKVMEGDFDGRENALPPDGE